MILDTTLSPRRQLTGLAAGLGHAILRGANAVLNALMAIGETSGRMRQIDALQRKSDEELAKMGLKREEIVHHVFRDHLI
jgi:uncharacterized protein YjiS (DUF1127 family)